MWRLRRQLPGAAVVAREGDLVVDGRIRARLFRLQLLNIDAHVVVTPALSSAHVPAPPAGGAHPGRRPAPGGTGRPARGDAPPPAGAGAGTRRPPPELGRAEQLIAEATSIIDEASRLR